MEQVGQRKIDGLWLTVVGIAVLFFLILPTLIGGTRLTSPPQNG
jgi:putative spermidine/putrescine transport system permease protein